MSRELAWVDVSVPAGLTRAPFDKPRRLRIPQGWSASVHARIDGARFLAPTPDGRLLVSRPGANQIYLVTPKPDGTATTTVFLGSGLSRPHDMVFAPVDGQTWLFISEADKVVRYPYRAGDTKAQPGTVVVDGLPDGSTPELRGQYAHVLKNIAVRGNTLYVSIASTCNICESDTVSDPQRATIYTYDATGHNANRKLMARGIRNAEGLAFAPDSADLWIVVNNRDNIPVPDDRDVDGDGKSDKGKKVTAYVDNHPPEEFIKVADGGFYGWPFCNPNIDNGLRNMPFDRDYDLNRDGSKADCSKATRVDVGLQAHSAPLGLTFLPGFGATIAMHGSWNSSVPVGYKVVHYPWVNGGPGEEHDLVTGFLDNGEVWSRPVDTAAGPDGSIFVSVDTGGAVLKLTPPAPSAAPTT